MEEKPQVQVCCAKVVINLVPRAVMKGERRFDLHDEYLVHHHIDPLAAEFVALVIHDDRDLSSHLVPAGAELPLQRHRVDMLQEPETQCVVYVVECTDDRAGQIFVDERAPFHGARYSGPVAAPPSFYRRRKQSASPGKSDRSGRSSSSLMPA